MGIMEERQTPNFTIGFLIGLLLCVILWYWQKSTAAEDGALELLERYAAQEKLWREKEQGKITAVPPLPPSPSTPTPPFSFLPIKGIGPIFNQRLQEAGMTTLADLLVTPADTLAELLNIGPNRAQAILANAQTL